MAFPGHRPGSMLLIALLLSKNKSNSFVPSLCLYRLFERYTRTCKVMLVGVVPFILPFMSCYRSSVLDFSYEFIHGSTALYHLQDSTMSSSMSSEFIHVYREWADRLRELSMVEVKKVDQGPRCSCDCCGCFLFGPASCWQI